MIKTVIALGLINAIDRPAKAQEYYKLTNNADKNIIEISGFIGWYDDDAQWLKNYLRNREGQDIELLLTSRGGDVYTGQHMYNALKAHTGKITCYVQQAFSIASHIVMGCDVVNIVKGSQMMIHAVSGYCGGTEDDFTAYAAQMANAKTAIANSYAERTGHDVDSFLDIMKTEAGRYYSDNECVELGLADAVIEPSAMTNHLPKDPPAEEEEETPTPTTPVNTPNVSHETTPLINIVEEDEMPKKELERQKSIRNLFNALQATKALPVTLLNAVLDDEAVDYQAAAMKFASFEPENNGDNGGKPPVNFGRNAGGTGSDSKEMVINVLLNRAGVEDIKSDYKDYSGLSLQNAAMQMGIEGAGDTLTNNAMVDADFVEVLGEIAQRSVQLEIQGTKSLVKEHCTVEKKSKLGEFGITEYHEAKALEKRDTTTGEFPLYALTGDPERKGIIEEFGRNFLVTRKAFINDEFEIITKLPRQFVQSAYRSADKNYILMLQAHLKASKITAADYRALMVAMANDMESKVSSDGDDLFYTGGVVLCAAAVKRVCNQINGSQYSDGIGSVNEAFGTFEKFISTSRLGDGLVSFAKDIKPVSLAVLHGREEPTLIQNTSVNPINGMGFGVVWDHGVFINNPKGIVSGSLAALSKAEQKALAKAQAEAEAANAE